ncbi:hypothetical protein R3I94_017783 [Phoxinus phoxinus]
MSEPAADSTFSISTAREGVSAYQSQWSSAVVVPMYLPLKESVSPVAGARTHSAVKVGRLFDQDDGLSTSRLPVAPEESKESTPPPHHTT